MIFLLYSRTHSQGDLYVPLEFDTEWEAAESLPGDSDDDSTSPSAEENSRGRDSNYHTYSGKGNKQHATVLRKSFHFDSGLVSLLGTNIIETVSCSNFR